MRRAGNPARLTFLGLWESWNCRSSGLLGRSVCAFVNWALHCHAKNWALHSWPRTASFGSSGPGC